MIKYKIHIRRPNHFKIKPQRENDTSIMSAIATHYELKTALRQINTCRMYVKATFISDISTATGDKINPQYFNGCVHESRINWSKFHILLNKIGLNGNRQ